MNCLTIADLQWLRRSLLKTAKERKKNEEYAAYWRYVLDFDIAKMYECRAEENKKEEKITLTAIRALRPERYNIAAVEEAIEGLKNQQKRYREQYQRMSRAGWYDESERAEMSAIEVGQTIGWLRGLLK